MYVWTTVVSHRESTLQEKLYLTSGKQAILLEVSYISQNAPHSVEGNILDQTPVVVLWLLRYKEHSHNTWRWGRRCLRPGQKETNAAAWRRQSSLTPAPSPAPHLQEDRGSNSPGSWNTLIWQVRHGATLHLEHRHIPRCIGVLIVLRAVSALSYITGNSQLIADEKSIGVVWCL